MIEDYLPDEKEEIVELMRRKRKRKQVFGRRIKKNLKEVKKINIEEKSVRRKFSRRREISKKKIFM